MMTKQILDYAIKNPHLGFSIILLILFMWHADKNITRVLEIHTEMVEVVKANTAAFTTFIEAIKALTK